MSESSCPNCTQEIVGAFCQNCGQKKDVYSLTWRGLFSDLQRRWFGFDNNFFRTVRDLTLRPEKVIQATIDGNRVRYIGPVGYYFLMVTIFVLMLSMLNIDMVQYTKDINSAFSTEANERQTAIQNSFQSTIFDNFRVASFLMAPFYIVGAWLIFNNKKLNFIKNSVLVFYAQGHPMLLSVVGLLFYKFGDYTHAITLTSPVGLIYFGWVCARFYKGNGIWNFVKGLLAYVVGMIIFALCIAIVTAILVSLNPGFIEGF